jgi:hypothetical protein
MKATLHFDHDETEELQDALDGWKWKYVVVILDQDLRSIVKHGYIGNREATEQEMEAADKLRSKLRELVNDYKLNI